jgi:hypothetical protein
LRSPSCGEVSRQTITRSASNSRHSRPGLRPKTIQLYRYLLRCHLAPGFAAQAVGGITEADVRRWRADLLATGTSPVTVAKAYHGRFKIVLGSVLSVRGRGDVTFCRDQVSARRI